MVASFYGEPRQAPPEDLEEPRQHGEHQRALNSEHLCFPGGRNPGIAHFSFVPVPRLVFGK